MKKNLNIYYDEEGDVLYLRIGKPTDCYHEDLGNDIFERRDEKTNEVKGFMILNFKKRVENQKRNAIKIPVDIVVNS